MSMFSPEPHELYSFAEERKNYENKIDELIKIMDYQKEAIEELKKHVDDEKKRADEAEKLVEEFRFTCKQLLEDHLNNLAEVQKKRADEQACHADSLEEQCKNLKLENEALRDDLSNEEVRTQEQTLRADIMELALDLADPIIRGTTRNNIFNAPKGFAKRFLLSKATKNTIRRNTMDNQEHLNNLSKLNQNVEYWEKVVTDLEKWIEPRNYNKKNGKRYDHQKIPFGFGLTFSLQGYSGHTILPPEFLEIIIKHAKKNLEDAKYEFTNYSFEKKNWEFNLIFLFGGPNNERYWKRVPLHCFTP